MLTLANTYRSIFGSSPYYHSEYKISWSHFWRDKLLSAYNSVGFIRVIQDARRELRNLELQHDEQLSELRQRLTADVSERALHLTRTQQSLTASAVNAAAEEQLGKMRQQLDKKTKKVEKLMDTVKKQLEIKRILENKLQKAIAQVRDAQGSAEALEKDYETQVKRLKETIQARNDEIANMNR